MKAAIIPARGGSKRIPRKNIRDFCGKPMIAWSILAAQGSNCFDRIVVSTEDDEIADIARNWGAEVPFMRPRELSDDFTGTVPVIRHAIQQMNLTGEATDFACCIYATAPFVSANDIREGYEKLVAEEADYAFSVTKYAFPIQRALRIVETGCVEMFQPDQFNTRSQDLEEAFHDAAQFYWGRANAWLDSKMIFSGRSLGIFLPRHRVQDIDTPEDWERAELMFESLVRRQGAA